MWLRAWGLDPDLLVARLARKRPVAFIGVAKIWREPRDRIARIAVLKLELPESESPKLESPAAACLLREPVDRGDRILPEAPAAHRVSGKLPAGSTGRSDWHCAHQFARRHRVAFPWQVVLWPRGT